MLGEVWLCSGQSNMEWKADYGINNGDEEVRNADFPNLRIFHLPQIGASTPQENCLAQWVRCSPETMRKTSALGYFFGRNISEELDVPVGIIVAAWGGTPAEVWTPKESIMSDPVLSDYFYGSTPWWPIEAGALFNSMIHPVMPYEIAGCIWYQGEANHTRADSYARLMQRMISSWRVGFNKEFPFYLVQIAPFTYNSTDNGPARLREQQAMLPKIMHKVKMITVSDLVDDIKDIHPRDKKGAGLRLSRLALDDVYGKFVGDYESPVFKTAHFKDNHIVISFEGIKKGLVIRGERIEGLKIAGDDRVWKVASATVKGNELIVSARDLKSPAFISYCFDDDSVGNLFSVEGVPVVAFGINF
nr:sialate O-acetylesterase [Bacteroides sp. 51]